MCPLIAEELRLNHITVDRMPLSDGLRQRRERLPQLDRRMHQEMGVRTWATEEDRIRCGGDLNAARGAAIGVALGAICWSLVGTFLYFIVL